MLMLMLWCLVHLLNHFRCKASTVELSIDNVCPWKFLPGWKPCKDVLLRHPLNKNVLRIETQRLLSCRTTWPTTPSRSGRSWAGAAIGWRSAAGCCTASSYNGGRGRWRGERMSKKAIKGQLTVRLPPITHAPAPAPPTVSSSHQGWAEGTPKRSNQSQQAVWWARRAWTQMLPLHPGDWLFYTCIYIYIYIL